MNPRFPLYIVSKGRADTRLTALALEKLGVPFRMVVEADEADTYAAVVGPERVLVLDPVYQRDYDTFDDLGDTKSKGPGPARNFAWAHSIDAGDEYHWVLDDNLQGFWRLHQNRKIRFGDGTGFAAMEDFTTRYSNVVMSGPQYFGFAKRKAPWPPFVLNTRIYSCNLIRNDAPYEWRGRYNEDTDLALRMLKDGHATILFNAFLQFKMPSNTIAGGNTDAFYAKEGTLPKSEMLVRMHPDVAKLTYRFGRVHHVVDYRRFRSTRLIRKRSVAVGPEMPNPYVLKLCGEDAQGAASGGR